MVEKEPQRDQIVWVNDDAQWPQEPDIDVIKSIAKRHLAQELLDPLDDSSLDVDVFDEGCYNKLYKITYAGHFTTYLLRVTIPIEPYYKTESEVATIAYLRANTSIPLPRVLAWNSNRSNELMFEWILMEKIEGVPLWNLWRAMPWKQKLRVTESTAGMVKQLRDQKFERIGGLYLASAIAHAPSVPDRSPEQRTLRKSRSSVDKCAKASLNDPKDEHVTDYVDNPWDESANEPAQEAVDKPQDEIVDEPANETHSEHSNEPIDKIVHELVEALINEIEDGPMDELMIANISNTDGRANTTAKPPTLGGPHLNDVHRKADEQFLSVSLSGCLINESQEGTKQLLPCIVSGNKHPSDTDTETLDKNMTEGPVNSLGKSGFAIGRMFDELFIRGNRSYLSANRGPYQNFLEWLSALFYVQLEFIKNGPIVDDDEYDEDDFEEESPIMERLCKAFLKILPTVYSGEERPEFCLYHGDLHTGNILVNPDTFEITGIVDWDFINVVPQWRVFAYPKYMRNDEPFSDTEPEIPIYGDDEDDEDDNNDMKVDNRDRWDDRILRRHFDQVMSRLTQDDEIPFDNSTEIDLKRDCRSKIREITENFNWPKNWLRTYLKAGFNRDSLNKDRICGEPSSDDEGDTWLDAMQT